MFECDEETEPVIVRLSPDSLILTQNMSPDLNPLLDRLAEEAGPHALILDFGDVELVSAAGLGSLVRLYKAVRAAGGWLILRDLDDAVYEVFEITRLTTLFDVRRRGGPVVRPDRLPLLVPDEAFNGRFPLE
jgi:anti-anti-sigma factor